MNELDLNAPYATQLTEDGVAVLTHGEVIASNVRENLRGLLKVASPADYAKYREIKYPGGDGTATDETRQAAARFLFDAARDLLCGHSVSLPDSISS